MKYEVEAVLGASNEPGCRHGKHASRPVQRATPQAVERASRLFRALGDAPRLRLLELLMAGERCVSEIVTALGEKFSTVSQRLRLLRTEGLVVRRRDGTHLYYALADRHVVDLIENALAHAAELDRPKEAPVTPKETDMADHTHAGHDHEHGPGCGHTAVNHDGHTDYLHDGHLHHPVGAHVEEHKLDVGGTNPAGCTPKHDCGAHPKGHVHGPSCGHEAVPHGDHTDYLVEGHLHHPHGDHCDDHGPVKTVAPQKQ